MRKVIGSLAIAVALALLVLIVFPGPDKATTPAYEALAIDWRRPEYKPAPPRQPHPGVRPVVEEQIRQQLSRFALLDSRVPGYAGHDQAAEEVKQAFERIGLQNVRWEYFDVCVPIDEGAWWTDSGGNRIPLHCLWPNGVRTPTLPREGTTGQLVYGRRGLPEELNGLPIKDNVVLLDFDSDESYMLAFMLGAKAVIFLDRGEVTRHQAEAKFVTVPADLPRFWADREATDVLLKLALTATRLASDDTARGVRDETETSGGAASAPPTGAAPAASRKSFGRLHARMTWQTKRVANIIGEIPGSAEAMPPREGVPETRWNDHVIVMQAYYDSISVVPARAPGAESACGIVGLLQLARSLTSLPPSDRPKYRMVFLATSAHFQALAGMEDFLYRHTRRDTYFRERIPPEDRLDPELFVCLDLTSTQPTVAAFSRGRFLNWLGRLGDAYRQLLQPYVEKRFLPYVDASPQKGLLINAVTPARISWDDLMGARLGFDAELVSHTGFPALTLATPNDSRLRCDTPADTIERVNISNLACQIRTITVMFESAGRDPEFFISSQIRRQDFLGDVTGLVCWFDRPVNIFLPQGIVRHALVTYPASPLRSTCGIRSTVVTRSQFQPQTIGDEGRGYRTEPTETGGYRLTAWASDLKHVESAEVRVKVDGGEVVTQRLQPGAGAGTFVAELPATAAVVESVRLSGPDGRWIGDSSDFRERFTFRMVRPSATQGAPTPVRAYVLDSQGNIVFAPDLGQGGAETYPINIAPTWKVSEGLIVLFPCRALTIMDTVDPGRLETLERLQVFDQFDSTPREFGYYFVDRSLLGDLARRENARTRLGVVFGQPGSRLKVIMSSSLASIDWLVTGADPDLFRHPLPTDKVSRDDVEARGKGRGLEVSLGRIVNPSLQAARDMWILNDLRIKQMARFNIVNDRVLTLHEEARASLLEAEQDLAHRDYEDYLRAARAARGLVARAFPEAIATADDAIHAVVFYMILLVPFSFFGERLLFGFPDIRKQIAGFAAIFLVIFLIIHRVHPAFQLSTSPYIVLLAFIILALGVLVTIIVSLKFGASLREQSEALADVNRIGATLAALILGISHLRRRKIRTTLVVISLTLLTFTILSFTSFTTKLSYLQVPRRGVAAFDGVLVRDRTWRALEPAAESYLASAFAEGASLSSRYWIIPGLRHRGYYPLVGVETGTQTAAVAAMGLSVAEGVIPKLASHGQERRTRLEDILVAGRWFQPEDRRVCILPTTLAETLSLSLDPTRPAPHVRFMGQDLELIGIVDGDAFGRLVDLDGEPFTPVDTTVSEDKLFAAPSPSAAGYLPIEEMIHVKADQVLVIPRDLCRDLGGTLRSVAIVPGGLAGASADSVAGILDHANNPRHASGSRHSDRIILAAAQAAHSSAHGATAVSADFQPTQVLAPFKNVVDRFLRWSELTIFYGRGDKVVAYSSLRSMDVGGAGSLFVPLLLGAIIVFNTMLNAVYERTKEIGVFSSVGLAPTHIAAFFMAESAVFATIGAVLGYVIAQIAAKVVTSFGGLSFWTLNYSSTAAVYATLLVIVAVLVSTIYPARMASRMAVPDVTRRWRIPEPQGDHWRIPFPFTVAGHEVRALLAYLRDVFRSYEESSVGELYARDISLWLQRRAPTIEPTPMLAMHVWIAPYDLGVSQRAELAAIPLGEHDFYELQVGLDRESGDQASWQRLNRIFLNLLRKRFLVWRTLGESRKDDYRKLAAQAFGPSDEASNGRDG